MVVSTFDAWTGPVQSENSLISRLLAQPSRKVCKPKSRTFKGKRFCKLSFQVVINSAASAASLDLQGSPRTTARGAALELPSLDFAFGEAALAADLIMA